MVLLLLRHSDYLSVSPRRIGTRVVAGIVQQTRSIEEAEASIGEASLVVRAELLIDAV